MKDYACYHAVCQYSADGCSGCKYEVDCYDHFLKYMATSKETSK
jgi:hypothetical protein